MAELSSAPLHNQEFAGCRLVEELHAGAVAHVFRGIRKRDNAAVVIKAIRPEAFTPYKRIEMRYEFEVGQALVAQGVKGVAEPLELWEQDGHCAIIFADVGGYSLRVLQLRRELRGAVALSLTRQLAAILGQVHQQGVIHKDINPSNVVYNPRSKALQLIDFGISIRLAREVQNVDVSGKLEGTLAYMPPEQTGRTSHPVDYRSDYYSLGVTLYELLAGALPFTDQEPLQLIHAVLTKHPPALDTQAAGVAPTLGAVLNKLLSKTPDKRYQSSFGLVHDLDLCIRGEDDFEAGVADRCERFEVPQKLYGRSAAIDSVLKAFQQANGGEQRFLMLAGEAGAGKSALLNALQPELLLHHALMARGKFEQFRRNLPLSAVIQAMEQLVRQILRDNQLDAAHWRERILASVDNVQGLLEVMPSLALLLGPAVASTAAAAPPEEQQPRSMAALQQLFEALPQIRPLVLLLDDLQWADDATWLLLQRLAKSGAHRLLVVGAYRHNEIGAEHPLHALLETLSTSGRHTQIALTPLQQDDIAALLADAMQGATDMQALAQLVYQKTAGNPFFVQAFVRNLWERKLLQCDPVSGAWAWDIDVINAANVTDNVVTLMRNSMADLPEETRLLLGAGACIGTRFGLELLMHVAQVDAVQAAAQLWPALQTGILVPIGRDYRYTQTATDTAELMQVAYQFAHDRVQQAAHGILTPAQLALWHQRIARHFLDGRSLDGAETWVFDVIDHVNQALHLFTTPSGRQEVLRLNIVAGQAAQRSGASAPAFEFFMHAAAALGDDPWATHHDLTLQVEMGLADCDLLCGRRAAGEARLHQLLTRLTEPLERAATVLRLHNSMCANDESFEARLFVLDELGHLGLRLRAKSSTLELVHVLMKVEKAFKKQPLTTVPQLPIISDPRAAASMQLLACVAAASFFATDGTTFMTCALWLAFYTLQYGLSPASAMAMTMYAMLVLVRKQDIAQAEQANATIDQILARVPGSTMTGTIYVIRHAMVVHFGKDLPTVTELCHTCWRLSMQQGDLFYGGLIGLIGVSLHTFYAPDQAANMAKHEAAYSLGRGTPSGALAGITGQFARALIGQTRSPVSLSSADFDEDAEWDQAQKLQNPNVVSTFLTSRMQLRYLSGDFATAEALGPAITVGNYFSENKLNVAYIMFALPYLLSCIGHARQQGRTRVHSRLFQRVLREVKRFARLSPKNYLGCQTLVAAELADLAGKHDDAYLGYEHAIGQLLPVGNLFFSGAAHELAGKAYARAGLTSPATGYLREALAIYRTWGVPHKAADMEKVLRSIEPQRFFNSNRQQVKMEGSASTRRDAMSSIEVPILMRASQAISQEVAQAKLVETLIRYVMENAGADRGVLLLGDAAAWQVAAYADNTTTAAANTDAPPLYAQSIVQFTARLREAVVLHDAGKDELLREDPYMRVAKPLALLCAPIVHKGEVKGIIYLENHATAGAFTPAHLEMTILLAAQAAISLENASVYAHLEDKVRERTRELEQAMQQVAALSRTDSLTGIPNRRHFMEALDTELNRRSRQPSPCALVMIDIDFFKKVNDTHGHQAGDAVLRTVARCLMDSKRQVDIAGRLGGEEFGVLLPASDLEGARRACERLRAAVEALAVPVADNLLLRVTISLGAIALAAGQEGAGDELYRQADAALYEAKHSGRNCAVLHPFQSANPVRSTR